MWKLEAIREMVWLGRNLRKRLGRRKNHTPQQINKAHMLSLNRNENFCLGKNLYKKIYQSCIYNRPKCKQLKCPSTLTGEWINYSKFILWNSTQQ